MMEQQYSEIEKYMMSQMKEVAHDREHVYRVLHAALEIARHEEEVDEEILIVACLLHDIGRQEQMKDPSLCHAKAGAEKAYTYLLGKKWPEDRAAWVRDCIATHRFRKDMPPSTIEAKILFDADKVDVTGAVGIARTLLYQGKMGEPLYTIQEEGTPDFMGETGESFFKEYHRKLTKLEERFYTKRGAEIGKERQKMLRSFYEALVKEIEEFR